MKYSDIEPLEARIAPATLSIGAISVTEGDTGTGIAKFTVTLDAPAAGNVTVQYTTTNGTAVAGADYVAVSAAQTLTFTVGETSKDINITVNGDLLDEADETFFVNLSNPSAGNTLGTAQGVGTITDNDPEPVLAVSSPTITEGTGANSTATFNVTLGAASSKQVTVNYGTLDGSATSADGDYTAATGTLVFAPGETFKNVVVQVTGDLRDEDPEDFFLTLNTPVNATTGAPGKATVNDDDTTTISVADVAIPEGQSGTSNAGFVVSLSTPSSKTVTVAYKTAAGTAVAGQDYGELALSTLTFAPGETSKTVPVVINGDTGIEANETFLFQLSSATNATISRPDATGTITTDDARLNVTGQSVTEGDSGTQNLVFTVTLTDGPAVGNVTVDFATQDATATSVGAAKDFAATNDTLTFAPGETSKNVTVAVAGDRIFEGNETFNLLLSNATGATVQAGQETVIGTITENETAPVISITGGGSIVEGNTGTANASFTVTLTGVATQAPVTVNYSTANGTATTADNDYAAIASTVLTFAPGETSKTILVPVTGDTKGEADETFSVILATPQIATLGAASSATATITNDDATLTSSGVSTVEGNSGVRQAIFTVTLNLGPASGNVTVNYATADRPVNGAASTGPLKDYEPTSGTLTFAPGETVKRIAVPIYGDLRSENNEGFTLNFTNAVGATLLQTLVVGTITDDEPTLSIGAATVAEGNAGTKDAVFTVTLSAPSAGEVTVLYDTLNGTATGGADFTSTTNGLITFAAGETSKTIVVPILGDAVREADETFTVQLKSAVNARLATGQATGTITNDDPLPTLRVGDVTISEGNSGLKTATFTVSLAGATDSTVRVTATAANGTATVGSDFLAATGELVFAPGETSKIFDVQIVGDDSGEADKTFAVNLSGEQNATIADGTGTGTITNDDAALSVSDVQIVEGNSGTKQAIFTVALAHGGSNPVTVQYATADDTATAAGTAKDYESASGTLTFAPNETSKTVSVTINGDTTAELDETFKLNLTNAVNAAIVRNSATGTIRTDETQFSVSDVTVVEGDTGTKSAVFTVSRIGATTGAATIAYATEDGTAVSTDQEPDFTATSGTVTFANGETFKTVVVPIVGDFTREVAEQFALRFSGATGGLLNGADAEGVVRVTGTITDNDPLPALSIGDATITEGDSGTKTATFTVSLSAKSDQPITVRYATGDGTATKDGGDFNTADGTLTFAPGETSKTISVAINGDAADEGDEAFVVNLISDTGGTPSPTNATLADAQGTGTILNDDLTVSVADASLAEGNAGTANLVFTVTLSQVSAHAVTFAYATQDGTATVAGNDYTAASGTVTIPAGQTTATINVPVKGDAFIEGNETILLNLSNVTGARLAATAATGTITDDDAPGTLSVGDVTIVEGDSGTSNATFTVTLSKASAQTVTVAYATADDTATYLGGDYTLAEGTLTFAPGQTTRTFTVPVIGDRALEPNETFKVLLSNAANATIADGEGLGTIRDVRAVSIGNVSQVEGNAGTTTFSFTVSLDSEAEQAVTVNYATSNGTASGAAPNADFAAATGIVTFAPGEKMRTIDVTVNGDATGEVSETFNVTLSNPVNATIAGGGIGVGTILNDDTTLAFASTAVAVTEGDTGTVNAVFVVTRGGDTSLAATVQYATAPDTAVSTGVRADFAARSGTLTFAAGETSKEILVPVTGDLNKENAEAFTLKLSNATNAVLTGSDTETATITDNDAAPTISVGDMAVTEGVSGTKTLTFTVSLSGANETGAVTVDYATQDGTAKSSGANADFESKSDTLTFAVGEVTKTVSITLKGDAIVEADETFDLLLSNPVNATIADATATGTISNDDGAVQISFDGASNGDVSIVEGNDGTKTLTFTVKLSKASQDPVTVNFASEEGTAKSSGASPDFVALTPGTLTFVPGDTSETFTVTINGDVVDEAAETLIVRLSSPVGATLADATATGTITDDDAAPVLSIAAGSVVEGDNGTKLLSLTVTLSGTSQETVTATYATVDDTAVSTGSLRDFVAQTGTVTFAPGETTKTIQIVVNGDTFKEADEMFSVALSQPANATLGTSSATATILQDGDSTVGLVLLDAQTTEGQLKADGTISIKTLEFTAQLTGPAASDVTFKLTTLNGTALAGVDYGFKDQTVTIAAGQTIAKFQVDIGGDADWEATESFFVNLTGLSTNAQAIDSDPLGTAQATARGSIFNDDVNFIGGRTVQWIDVDGDLVTFTVSKGALNFSQTNPTGNTSDLRLVSKGTVGGYELQKVSLGDVTDGTEFAAANVSIIATKQPGFVLPSDGRVDVGWIAATTFLPDQVQVQGVDLGTVTVDGDLARITSGDGFSTPAIRKLDVYSLGVRGTATGAPDTESKMIGPITTVDIKQNLAGLLYVIGEEFGTIGTLKIGGALQGGSTTGSGAVSVTGRIGSVVIGSITGGSGDNSGLILATSARGSIGSVKVLGDITGGSGNNSGMIWSTRIGNFSAGAIIGGSAEQRSGMILSDTTLGNVTLTGGITGGSGVEAGKIFGRASVGKVKIAGSLVGGAGQDSGAIVSFGNMASLAIGGALVGGDGETSGSVQVSGRLGATSIGENLAGDSIAGGTGKKSGRIDGGVDLASVVTTGNVRGGTGDGTGVIFTNGTIAKLSIGGSLVGADVPEGTDDAIDTTGYIQATKLTSVTIGGNIEAGDKGAGSLVNSGAIRGQYIGSLTVGGDLIGKETNAVIVSALGGPAGPAIKTLLVKGRVDFAEILAGYQTDPTAENPRGTAQNADASIGSVTINGSVKGLSIVAGGDAGTDGRFGTADDRLIFDSAPSDTVTVFDNARLISQIASVVIKGDIETNDLAFGVIAQHIVSFKVGAAGTTPVALLRGAGNDFATSDTDPDPGVEIATGSKFRALELRLPS